jgi:ESCRT-II complex subunit VPS22
MSHRRRGVGVSRRTTGNNTGPKAGQRRGDVVRDGGAGGNNTMAVDNKLQKKTDEMHALSMQSAVDTIEKLQIKLTEFAKEHQSDIQDDPAFRKSFLQMCAPLGIDPLVSQKGFW